MFVLVLLFLYVNWIPVLQQFAVTCDNYGEVHIELVSMFNCTLSLVEDVISSGKGAICHDLTDLGKTMRLAPCRSCKPL